MKINITVSTFNNLIMFYILPRIRSTLQCWYMIPKPTKSHQ